MHFKGTFLAIVVTYITYICYGTMIGSVYLANASGSVGMLYINLSDLSLT